VGAKFITFASTDLFLVFYFL